MNRILNFHQVNDSIWFDEIVSNLRSKYVFVSAEDLSEFYKGNISLKNSVHITIDDGDNSFYKVIFPILQKHKIPASIFVSPKICIEETNFWFQEIEGYNQLELKRLIADMTNIPLSSIIKFSSESILKNLKINQIQEIIIKYRKLTHTSEKLFQNMNVTELKEVYQSGLVAIGAHTINHPVLKNEDDATSKYEICESINELSGILNHEIKYFSYPNGMPGIDFTDRERTYLKENGIQLAFSTQSKNFSILDEYTSIPRFGISNKENNLYFETKMYLGSNWERLTRLKPNGEYRERKELIRIFSKSKIPEQNF